MLTEVKYTLQVSCPTASAPINSEEDISLPAEQGG